MNRLTYFSAKSLWHKKLRRLPLLVMPLFILKFAGCFGCPYSFSGASVPQHMKTIAVPFADDKSGAAEPGLREMLTTQLTQKFISDNNLRITDRSKADAVLEMAVTAINDAPAVVLSGENVATRRVTLSVQVVFKDLVMKKVVFEKQFSNTGDYSLGGGIVARAEALKTAVEKITDDILLDTVSGW